MKCCHDLRQGVVDLPGQLDAVVLVDTDQCVTGISRCAMTARVSSQEPDYRCQFLWMLEEKGRGLDRFGARRSSPPIRTKRNHFRNVRTLSHIRARVQHFIQQSRLASITAQGPAPATSL
jgi:hypothetical protein